MQRFFSFFLLTQVGFLLFSKAWAFGPAAHLHYGLFALDQLSWVGDAFRSILAAEPLAFLYGSVGADIVLAKKLGSNATHCHRWENAWPLFHTAKTPRTQAFALGYLSHLAADTISHNCFVPSKTIESYAKGVFKHLYWEMRFDQKTTTPQTLRLFEEIARGSFEDCDRHMMERIPTRILGFSFNKSVFNGLLILQGLRQWQDLLGSMGRSDQNQLSPEEFTSIRDRAQSAVLSLLSQGEEAFALDNDPIGALRLRQSNELRRHFWMQQDRHPDEVERLASRAKEAFWQDPAKKIEIEEYRLKV